MEEDANRTRARRRRERDSYLKGLSDRTRTLCLGTLALIWGVLSQKEGDHGIHVSRPIGIALLAVGLAAIVVLVLDFGEYACAYQERRKLAGDPVKLNFRYDKWEERMRFSKIILGVLTLAALCLVLSFTLAKSVLAKSGADYPYLGKWCGGSGGSFTCLLVTQPTSTINVQISFAGMDGWIKCTDVAAAEEGKLEAECGETNIKVSDGDDPVTVILYLEENEWHDTRVLLRQPESISAH